MSFISKIFGDANARVLKNLEPIVARINELEKEYEKLSNEELRAKTEEFKNRIKNSESLDDILPDAFAAVREAAKRTLAQRHFNVQIMGGVVLHRGEIAEMKTGEGKTLVATLPAYLNALEDKGVHIVTVNDYLARRDAVWMGQVFNALGITVGCIAHDTSFLYDPAHSSKDKERDELGAFKVVHEFLRPCSRKEAYAADIIYGTNNEFGFDYLRDNMAYLPDQISQRGHNFAIVDEIDSILIDEARTPLIISAPDEESAELYKTFARITPRLSENTDYKVDEKMKSVSITEAGIEKVEKMLGVSDIYSEKGIRYVHQLEQALRAKVLFLRDRDYVVKSAPTGGGEVIIVDEFTGRLMPGRRWSEGLHQAVEAKEGVQIQRESRTLATITFQNYFRLYRKLSGMTGTAQTSAEEFHKVYGLEVVKIPTNKTLQRKDFEDKVFQSENGKWKALAKEIKERHSKGQSVLVGTVSIEKNEKLSTILTREGVPHRVLNAKKHEEEGAIIAQAGKFGAVTVATNMAGRGVDIVLGGNPPEDGQASRVKEAGGLLVIGTERHEARRIDDQLRGRSGRQGDPGETQFYVSLEDDLMRIFGSDRIKRMMGAFGIPEDEPIENKLVSRAIESAQAKIEGFNFDSRKHVLEYDDVMNKQRQAIYKKRKDILFSDEEEQKRILKLRIIDLLWMEHIEAMEYMRSSVRLRAYGQRDPLIEYKNEGARMFKILLSQIDLEIENLSKAMEENAKNVKSSVFNIKPSAINNQQLATSNQVGRNDPCPCGSGRKYKKCHGA